MEQESLKLPTCWFCGAQPKEEGCASVWDMYREFEPLPGLKSYEPATVPVPRCARCKQAHDRREQFVERGWKAGLKVGLVLGSALLLASLLVQWGDVFGELWGNVFGSFLRPSLFWLFVPFVILCAAAGGIIGWWAGKSSLPPGVKDQGAAVLYPRVKELEAAGWKIGRKPPR